MTHVKQVVHAHSYLLSHSRKAHPKNDVGYSIYSTIYFNTFSVIFVQSTYLGGVVSCSMLLHVYHRHSMYPFLKNHWRYVNDFCFVLYVKASYINKRTSFWIISKFKFWTFFQFYLKENTRIIDFGNLYKFQQYKIEKRISLSVE